ncbi:MAG: lipid-A-disaccharide synthase [Bacteroidales bacterium]|nr:lipid-A-disaccharide synthase [Bacteroidales bacterium]
MKYYIIAGEASGDLHGSNLIRALKARDSEADIRFWGGDLMAAAGGTMVKSIRDLAYMGYVEVLSHAGEILRNIRFCKKDIVQFNPDVVVFIDYPGFNLRMAKFTHDKGYYNVYYISPQVWAWKKGRIKAMRKTVARLCCILPFEQQFYVDAHFPQATYVGHPLLDEVARFRASGQEPDTDERPLIALLPGSRKQEVRKMLPVMMQLAAHRKEYRYEVAAMSLLGTECYEPLLANKPDNVTVRYDATYEILSRARAAVVCSGTATLEAALFRVPQVVCYSANLLSIFIAGTMLHIKYISLVNLIADQPVVRELIQTDFNLATLDSELRLVANDGPQRNKMLDAYDQIINLLGHQGASDRVAQECLRARN